MRHNPEAQKFMGFLSFLILVYLLTKEHGGVQQVLDALAHGTLLPYSPQADGDDGRYFYG